jgi:hypothetical protein
MGYNFTAANSRYLSAGQSATASPLTLAAWIRPTATGGNQTAVSVHASSNSDRCSIGVTSSATRKIRAPHVNDGGAAQTLESTASFTDGQWCHACGVFTSTASRTVYLNGGSSASGTTNIGSLSAFNTTLVGANIASGSIGTYFNGDIAEVGIWNAALTAAEVASLAKGMTCDKVRPESLVFYAPLVRDLQRLVWRTHHHK